MGNPIFVGKIRYRGDNPKELCISFEASSRSAFNEYAKKLGKGEKVKVIVSRLTKKKIRSAEQNNYYWGVVIEILADHFGYIGPGEREEFHNVLRSLFLVKTSRIGTHYAESTTRLDTETFEKYLEAVRSWAWNEHQVKIPLPNDVEITGDNFPRL